MTTVILLRHGRTTANTGGVLAGWTPGVQLDETGAGAGAGGRERLAAVPLAAVVSSPLERCQQTAGAVVAGRDLELQTDDRLGEARYGDWTGRPIKELVKEPLWKVVQQHPSAAVFPGPEGEGLAQTQARAVAAVRDWNAELGPDAVWLACSHGDVIKAILADALGLHLDPFQRIVVDPASISVITLHRHPALRGPGQRHRRRRLRAHPAAAEAPAPPDGVLRRRRRRRRRRDADARDRRVRRVGRPRNLTRAPSGLSLRPSRPGSSPAPWASRGTAPSTCRPPTTAAARSASRWRSRRCRCSPTG